MAVVCGVDDRVMKQLRFGNGRRLRQEDFSGVVATNRLGKPTKWTRGSHGCYARPSILLTRKNEFGAVNVRNST